MSFRVVSVSPDSIIGEEQLGSKTKFWFARGGERWLFKEGRAHTGEDWAEKVAAEIARLIGVEAARVELAEYGGRQGSASSSFVRPAENLIHGNEILGGMILGYDPTKRLHQSDHTLANIAASVRRLVGSDSIYENVLTTLAGYAVLDALICNTRQTPRELGIPGSSRRALTRIFRHACESRSVVRSRIVARPGA